MIRLRLATDGGFCEITPATLTRWVILAPDEAWYLLGLNPSWNPPTE